MLTHVLARSLPGAVLVAGLAIAGLTAPVRAQSDDLSANGDGIEVPGAPADRSPEPLSEDVTDREVAPPGSEAAESPASRDEGPFGRTNEALPVDTPPPAAEPTPAANDIFAVDPASASTKRAPSPLLEKRGPDYYDRRAAELLKEDRQATDAVPHPLASAFPNQFVVVCAAGCRDGSSAMIVGMTPRLEPVAKPAAGTDRPGVVSCIGGCPAGSPGTFIAMPSPAAGGARVAATVGEWMTTVAEVPGSESAPAPRTGSGDWMARINAERAPGEATPAPSAAEPKPMAAIETPKAAAAPAAPAKDEVKPAAAEPNPMAAIETPKAAAAPTVPAKEEAKPAPAGPTPMAAIETPKAAAAPAVPAKDEAKPAPAEPTPMAAIETPKAAAAPAVPAKDVATPASPQPTVAAVAPPADAAPAGKAAKDKVVSVLSEDKEMNAAIEKARASLPSFWQSYEAPGPNESDFALKVAISGNGSTEHFWLTRIKREGDKLSGLISNQPQSVKTVQLGERYAFSSDLISDWTFKRNGKLVGNETMRVLLPRMPEEQAAAYRQMYETP